MISKKNAAFIALAVLLIAGCASTVTMTVQRTPTIDTRGIQRIAILPFEAGDGSALQREAANVITRTATSNIQATGQFTLVDSSQIQRLQQNRESIENHVDALFSGTVITLNVIDRTEIVKRRRDGVEVDVTMYIREVELAFDFNLRRARDGSIIGMATKRGRDRDSDEDRAKLRTPSQMIVQIVNHRLRDLYKDVAPYTETVRRHLMEDKVNKGIKDSMKNAYAHVKAQNYRVALAAYLEIHSASNSYAAAYNAMVLHEALGETMEAFKLMEWIFQETGNPGARTEMARLTKVMEEEGLLAGDYSEQRSQREIVVDFAVGEIKKALPNNPRVWIVNRTDRNERALGAEVIDNITAALVNSGITVVDRDNARLMAAEAEFQLSGMTSDDDFMSIGNAAGANTLITIEITGTGHMRRLRVEVLDIERRTRVFMSDSSESWRL